MKFVENKKFKLYILTEPPRSDDIFFQLIWVLRSVVRYYPEIPAGIPKCLNNQLWLEWIVIEDMLKIMLLLPIRIFTSGIKKK